MRRDVLIVDDDSAICESMSDLIEENGYAVDSANNAEAGISLAAGNTYAIIFLDNWMPGMRGVEALKQLRVAAPKSFVIMLSAYDLSDAERRLVQEEGVRVLTKPLDPRYMIDIIERVRRGIKILVVDDEASVRETLSELLYERGKQVSAVSGGSEAIKAAKRERFDLNLIDLVMPEMNGLETYFELRKINPEAKNVVITGHDKAEVLAKTALRNNADGFLRKPIRIGDLLGFIGDVVLSK